MKKFNLFLLLLILIACNDVPQGEVFDTTGYTVEEMGSNTQRITRYGQDGKILDQGFLVNGLKHGNWESYTNSHTLLSTTSYLYGKKNGVYFEWDSNGRVTKIIHYLNDEYDGLYKEMRSYVSIKEANYRNGKYHGIYKEFDPQGKVTREMEYKDGILDGMVRYYDGSGAVSIEYEYKNGEKVEK